MQSKPELQPQTVEQVWFSGAHSNIGGGYPDAGLSDIAFLWMAAKAAQACDQEEGVSPLALDMKYLIAKVSRNMGQLVDARRWLWRLLPSRGRQMFVGTGGKHTFERVHRSAVIRYRWSGQRTFEPYPYRPRNAEPHLREPDNPMKIAEFCGLELQFGKWLASYKSEQVAAELAWRVGL